MSGTDSTTAVADLKEWIRQFVTERDWDQYHPPKDLAIGLSIEAGELLEHFRFRSDAEMTERLKDADQKQGVAHELADVLYFVLLMCANLDLDATTILREKLAISAQRYPVDQARGRNVKYTELDTPSPQE